MKPKLLNNNNKKIIYRAMLTVQIHIFSLGKDYTVNSSCETVHLKMKQ